MKRSITPFSVAPLILVFVYAAVSKLMAFRAFGAGLHAQPFPPGVADILRFLLPAAELAAAAMLIFPESLRYGLRFSLALLVLFTGYVGLALLHFWGVEPCPCGGLLTHTSWGVHLVLNICLIGLNLLAIVMYHKERRSVC